MKRMVGVWWERVEEAEKILEGVGGVRKQVERSEGVGGKRMQPV